MDFDQVNVVCVCVRACVRACVYIYRFYTGISLLGNILSLKKEFGKHICCAFCNKRKDLMYIHNSFCLQQEIGCAYAAKMSIPINLTVIKVGYIVGNYQEAYCCHCIYRIVLQYLINCY